MDTGWERKLKTKKKRDLKKIEGTTIDERWANYEENRRERDKRMFASAQKFRQTKKRACFEAYSNGALKCACCGESEYLFLQLDHVFNDGATDRSLAGCSCLYTRLASNHFPYKERYQLLCANCNFGKRMNNGICPHKGVNIEPLKVQTNPIINNLSEPFELCPKRKRSVFPYI